MLISERHRFIFLHTYKTGGMSIYRALRPYANPYRIRAHHLLKHLSIQLELEPFEDCPHLTASALIEKIGREQFASLFSFAFIRNPWDWQVSLFTYMKKTPSHPQHDLMAKFKNFHEYLQWRCTEDRRLQKDFIFDANGTLLVDYVGCFETLQKDFAELCSILQIRTKLRHFNSSNRVPYQNFYTNENDIELVKNAFAEDIELFGYEYNYSGNAIEKVKSKMRRVVCQNYKGLTLCSVKPLKSS